LTMVPPFQSLPHDRRVGGPRPRHETSGQISAHWRRCARRARRQGEAIPKDMFGRPFKIKVDAEHKATEIKIPSCSGAHMHAFHASWFGFFSTFFSTFAPAPLAPTLKKAHTLGLTRPELQIGGIASVTSNIVCRLLMGLVCDKLGPRKGLAFVLLITAPAIIGIAFVQGPVGFIVCRGIIGMGLASFVACQVWCSQMFSKSVVGVANATAGGWGNLGGGVTTLTIPFIYRAFMSATNDDENLSWRLCFIVPLVLHLLGAVAALTGQDLPDGNYKELELTGSKQKSKGDVVLKVGLSNINAWILTITYGLCFGVELTMTNVVTLYFYEYHAFSQTIAGTLGSIFGLVNICARSLGGITSDWANRKFGMRGRVWALWIFQTLEGVLCIIMGLVTMGYAAPDFTAPKDVLGATNIDGVWTLFNGTGIEQRIVPCGSLQVELTDTLKASLPAAFADLSTVVISDPPAPLGNGDDCISNQNLSVVVVLIMFCFSLAVQMAEGLTYGIVPSVSRPALGVVSGMVGAGGNAGALVTNWAFFVSDSVRTDTGFINMGILIIVGTLFLFGCYFPDMGGMLCKSGALAYDPQRIKPPKGYKGSDEIAITNTSTTNEKAAEESAI